MKTKLREVKLNHWDLSDVEGNELIIIPFGDMHVGSKQCNMDKVRETLEWVKNKPNAYIIGMGDYMNVGTKYSVGRGPFDDNLDPQEQYEAVMEMLEPVKHKILGLHAGNHEERVTKTSAIDLTKNLCRELNVRFLGFAKFSKIKFGDHNYIFYSTHGSSGARLPYTKIKAVVDLANSFDADIYLMGHLHDLDTFTDYMYKVDMRHALPKKHKRYFILTGHFLEYTGSYAEMKNMRPGKTGVAKVKLFRDRKDVHITL